MSSIDLETMHGLAPVINALPGEAMPYYLASGEGLRFETDGQLWTVIARGSDTGGLFDAAYVLGPRGAQTPFHSLPGQQRSYFVVDGSVQVWLPGESRVLVPGDSVHVPQGTPFAYRMLSHMTRMLFYSAPSGALDALVGAHPTVERHVYSPAGGGTPFVPGDPASGEFSPALDDDAAGAGSLPEGTSPYVLRGRYGDRRAWPDTVNAYAARGRNTDHRYFAVDTLAAPQPYIIRHFHEQHTENFLCLSGRIWIWVNGHEVLLTEGDFLHAPAGTIHRFAIAAHNTRMLGLLTSDVFEPFFDVTGVPTDDLVYTEGLIDPSNIMQGMQANPELDVVVVGGPPERSRAVDL